MRTLLVFACILPFVLLNQFARRFSFAHHEVGRVLLIDVTVGVLQVSGLLTLGLAGRLTALTAFMMLGAANGVAGATWLVVSRSRFAPRRDVAVTILSRHWRFGRWDLLAGLLGIGHLYGVYGLLALDTGTEAIGIFAASLAVVSVSNPLITGVSNVLTPTVASARADHGDAEMWRVIKKAAVLGAAFLAIPAVALMVTGGRLVELLYGEGYGGQDVTVAILAISVPVWWGEIAATSGLGSLERPDRYTFATSASLVLTMVVAVPLVAVFGMPGAAAALAAGGVTETVLDWMYLRRLIDLSDLQMA